MPSGLLSAIRSPGSDRCANRSRKGPSPGRKAVMDRAVERPDEDGPVRQCRSLGSGREAHSERDHGRRVTPRRASRRTRGGGSRVPDPPVSLDRSARIRYGSPVHAPIGRRRRGRRWFRLEGRRPGPDHDDSGNSPGAIAPDEGGNLDRARSAAWSDEPEGGSRMPGYSLPGSARDMIGRAARLLSGRGCGAAIGAEPDPFLWR